MKLKPGFDYDHLKWETLPNFDMNVPSKLVRSEAKGVTLYWGGYHWIAMSLPDDHPFGLAGAVTMDIKDEWWENKENIELDEASKQAITLLVAKVVQYQWQSGVMMMELVYLSRHKDHVMLSCRVEVPIEKNLWKEIADMKAAEYKGIQELVLAQQPKPQVESSDESRRLH